MSSSSPLRRTATSGTGVAGTGVRGDPGAGGRRRTSTEQLTTVGSLDFVSTNAWPLHEILGVPRDRDFQWARRLLPRTSLPATRYGKSTGHVQGGSRVEVSDAVGHGATGAMVGGSSRHCARCVGSAGDGR